MGILSRFVSQAKSLGLVGQRVLIAVSGGADSICLLRAFSAAQETLQVQLVVGHVNHGLRGNASDDDARFVQDTCESLSIDCIVGDLAFDSATSGVEESARNARYRFLTETASQSSCPFIAVGHTSDDQAETVLHHILRGTGIAGLRGIPIRRHLGTGIELVRPLLGASRADVVSFLDSVGQTWREDQSNQLPDYTRNRIRNELIPLIRRDFNEQITKVLNSLAQQSVEWHDVLQRDLVRPLTATSLLHASTESLRYRCSKLVDQPRVLVREVFHQSWIEQGWPRKHMGFAEWDSMVDIAHGQLSAKTLPGRIDARRRGDILIVTRPST